MEGEGLMKVKDLRRTLDGKFVMVHDLGCHGVAFFYEGRVGPGEIVKAECATFPNGSKPQAGESPMRCGTCNEPIEVGDFIIYVNILRTKDVTPLIPKAD